MPGFFVPFLDDPERAEELWQATKAFAEDQSDAVIESRRIFHLGYFHEGWGAQQRRGFTGEPNSVQMDLDSISRLRSDPPRSRAAWPFR